MNLDLKIQAGHASDVDNRPLSLIQDREDEIHALRLAMRAANREIERLRSELLKARIGAVV